MKVVEIRGDVMFLLDIKSFKKSPGLTEKYIRSEEFPTGESKTDAVVFSGPVMVDVDVTNLNGNFVLKGTVKGQVLLRCDRCLEDFSYPIEAELREIYQPISDLPVADNDSENDNGDIIGFKGDYINITPELVKSVFLALPMKTVCNSECVGLCPHCGINLNKEKCDCAVPGIDPRLVVLKNLLKG